MNVKQKFSILFYLKRKKASKDGKIPIYVRITIDGLKDEFSLGCKVLSDHWENKTKTVLARDPDFKAINKEIGQVKVDIERHFDLCQAKNELATPQMVKESYLTPISGERSRLEQVENLELSESIDAVIKSFISYCEKSNKACQYDAVPAPAKLSLLKREKEQLSKDIEQIVRKANSVFDNKQRQKTFRLALDEFLLNFLQLSFSGHRSFNTIEKWIGRKRRYFEFLTYRYKQDDIPLAQLEYKFCEELYKYVLIQHKIIPNTAMKYVQWLKEVMNRAVANGWINSNVFALFKCKFTDPKHDWLNMDEMERLLNFHFEKAKLNIIRDIFLFGSFTGLSYTEIYSLKPSDVVTEIGGKKWVSKCRQKTGAEESLPLLPIPLQILE